MESVHLAIAAIPVAIYLILVGALRLRTRPLITTGWRDILTLGIAASGLVAIGPMQLFFPTQAAARWNGWVWLALAVLYGLGILMILLSCKPRLISYGMNESQFRTSLLAASREIDQDADWQGDILNLPNCAMQLAAEPSGTFRVHQVLLVGALHNLQAWLQLERAFVKASRQVRCPRSTAGWPLVVFGSVLLALVIAPLLANPGQALAQLREFIRR